MSFKSFQQNLRRVARELPDEPLPGGIRERVQDRLPNPSPNVVSRRLFTKRLVVAGLATAALGTAFLLAPRSPLISRSEAAEMRAAIQKAQTWHFIGSRVKDGKSVKWEVWGRRAPFLYREQIGEEILVDDGKRRIHLLPPDSTKSPATYLITPSERLQNIVTDERGKNEIHAGFLAGIGSENTRFDSLSPMTQNPQLLRSETVDDFGTMPPIRERTSLEVDSATHLPVRYRVVQETHRPPSDGTVDVPLDAKPTQVTTVAELTAEYDTPLPVGVETVALPPGYTVADATKTPDGISRDGSVYTNKGLTLQATVVARDTTGNIRIRLNGWLGGVPVRDKTQGLSLMVRAAESDAVTTDSKPGAPNYDDMGNTYIPFSQPLWTPTDTEHPELWLTPVIHLSPGNRKQPTTLHIRVEANLSRYEKISNTGRMTAVLKSEYNFELRLPPTTRSTGWDETPTSSEVQLSEVRPTCRLKTAEARAWYYSNRNHAEWEIAPDGKRTVTNQDEQREWLRQSEYWYKQAKQEAERIGDRTTANRAQQNIDSVRQRTQALTIP